MWLCCDVADAIREAGDNSALKRLVTVLKLSAIFAVLVLSIDLLGWLGALLLAVTGFAIYYVIYGWHWQRRLNG